MEEHLSASFDAATRFVESNSSRFSDKVLLRLYGYYKQATHGPCTLQQKRPGMFDFKGRAKYDAWARLGADVTISQAQRMYVNLLTESIPDWEQEKAKQAHGPVFSMPMAAEETEWILRATSRQRSRHMAWSQSPSPPPGIFQ